MAEQVTPRFKEPKSKKPKARKRMKRTELKRSSGIKPSGQKPRKPMKQRSTKTGARDRYYSRLRSVWMSSECGGKIPGVHEGQAVDVHHMKGRGLRFMLDVSTWVALCRACHQHITVNPLEGKRLGLIRDKNERGMTMASYSHCKSCGRPIYWVKTQAGASMPLDADVELELPLAHEDNGKAGRVQEAHTEPDLFGEVDVYVVHVLDKGTEADDSLPIWGSHFATCPQADEHRKG